MATTAPSTSAPRCTCRGAHAPAQGLVAPRRQRSVRCNADASLLQEVIVGSAVTAATAAALLNGQKREPEVCAGCAGTGGIKCFACEGSGKLLSVSREALAAASTQRDPLGGSRSKRECVACKGAGKIFCRQCSGSGYTQGL